MTTLRYRTPLFLTALLGGLLFSLAFAQDVLPGVPAQYQPMATAVIGVLAGWMVYLFTALAKRWKVFGVLSGVKTVTVSFVLSIVASAGWAVWQALVSRGDQPWQSVVVVTLWAFLQANLTYLAKNTTTSSAVKAALDGAPDTSYSMAQADPSRLPGFQAGDGLMGAQPLLGGAIGAVAAGLLGSPMLEGVVKALLHAAGLSTGADQVLEVGARLAPIAPDLFDGNPQLDTANLARINRVILDLKHEKGLS